MPRLRAVQWVHREFDNIRAPRLLERVALRKALADGDRAVAKQ